MTILGYAGVPATRIWKAIYEENCFEDGDKCMEKRVFFRLISGLHTSITVHLAYDYLLDRENGVWVRFIDPDPILYWILVAHRFDSQTQIIFATTIYIDILMMLFYRDPT